MFVTDAEALVEIKRLAQGGQVRFTRHAYDRMRQRGADDRDALKALVTATKATSNEGTYAVSGGVDTDQDQLSVVVALEGDVLVITLF